MVVLPEQELFLSWIDINDAGNDHGLAIDDLTLTYQSINATVSGPSFITQPVSQTVGLGETATFTVQASGTAPLSYQWNFEGNPISGANGTALSVAFADSNKAGNYTVTVQNSVNTVTSSNAVLTVTNRTSISTNIAYLRTLMTAAYAPADTTNLYTIEGTVTTFVNMTTATNCQFYIQDNTGGIAVFSRGSYFRPAAGDYVRVTGPLGHISGLYEMNLVDANPAHTMTILSNSAPLPNPALFQFSSATNNPLMETTVEGSVVVVSNVYLQFPGTEIGGGGTNYNMTNLNGQVFVLRVDARVSDVIGQFVPTFASSIVGVMSQFDSSSPHTTGYQLTIRRWADLVEGTPVPPLPNPIPVTAQKSGNDIVLTWSNPAFVLQSANAVNGPYNDVVGATSPYPTPLSGTQRYFRLIAR